jgi:hypothetical protein
MRNRLKLALVVVAALVAGCLAAWKLAPDRRTDAERILTEVAGLQAAVEAKNVRQLMDHVSENYSDSICENKRALTRLAISGLHEPGGYHCQVQSGRPQIEGARATLDLLVDFRVVRGGQEHTVRPFPVRTEWAKEGPHWRVIRAEGYMEAEPAIDGGL